MPCFSAFCPRGGGADRSTGRLSGPSLSTTVCVSLRLLTWPASIRQQVTLMLWKVNYSVGRIHSMSVKSWRCRENTTKLRTIQSFLQFEGHKGTRKRLLSLGFIHENNHKWQKNVMKTFKSTRFSTGQNNPFSHVFLTLFSLYFLICFLRDTFGLCLVNGGSSFVAGLAIFSVLGFMSYEQGLPISQVAASGKIFFYFHCKKWNKL